MQIKSAYGHLSGIPYRVSQIDEVKFKKATGAVFLGIHTFSPLFLEIHFDNVN